MATSVNLGFCPWLAGATWNDNIGRLDVAATTFNAGTGGVLQTMANPLQVLAGSGMNLTVNPGAAVVPSSAGPAAGSYRPVNPTAQTLTVPTAPASPNTRVDIVVINVVDNGNNTSYSEVQIVSGAAGSPGVAPAQPTNSLLLGTIAVGSGVTSISQSNITDNRMFTVAAGGIVWVPNMANMPAGMPGQVGYDVANNRLFALGSSGVGPLRVLSFPPAAATPATASVNCVVGSETTLLTTQFTTPGSVDVEVIGRITDTWSTYGPYRCSMRLYIDATLVQENYIYTPDYAWHDLSSQFRTGSHNITHVTSAAKGTTPASGSHTAKLAMQPFGDNGSIPATKWVTVYGASYTPIELSVSQASL